MILTLSDTYRFPSGKPMADAVAKLFALQGRETIRQLAGQQFVSLSNWNDYFADKLFPYFLWHAAEGWRFQRGRLQRATNPAILPDWSAKSMFYKAKRTSTEESEDTDRRKWLLLLLGLFDEDVVADIRAMVRRQVAFINQTTTKRVNAILQAYQLSIARGDPWTRADLNQKLRAVFLDDKRALLIGEDESMRAFHFGMLRVLEDSRLEWEKTWRTAADEKVCPVCMPLDGKTVALGESFVSGDTIAFAPPIHGHCRCRLSFKAVVVQSVRELLGA